MIQLDETTLVPFQREKLFLSIYESCRHRPQAVEEALSLTQAVISNVLEAKRGQPLTRQLLVDIVQQVLQAFDSTTATVYQAVHR